MPARLDREHYPIETQTARSRGSTTSEETTTQPQTIPQDDVEDRNDDRDDHLLVTLMDAVRRQLQMPAAQEARN